jgi:endo-1,4-beta-xylanase
MKIKNIFTVLLVAFILVSCAPEAKVVPTETAIPTSTFTPAPTATITPTSIPAIDIEDLSIPDPHFSNPDFFDFSNTNSPIVQFANAFELQPADIISDLNFKVKQNKNGVKYVILGTSNDYPLFISQQDLKNGQWIWDIVTLRTLSFINNPDFQIGATAHYPIYGDELNRLPELEKILATAFNAIILENHLRWNGLEKQQGSMDKTRMEQVKQLVDFANANNQLILGQHVFYYYEYPDWLKNGTFTEEEIQLILENRADSVMKRFPQINTWVVVNEFHPISLGWHDDFLQSKVGTEKSLLMMFQAAQLANPNATLLISDSYNETMDGANYTRTLNYVKFLQENGIKNIGVGLHLHRNATLPLNQEAMTKAIISYNVPVFITEADVDLRDISLDNKNRLTIQAEEFSKALGACLNTENCKGFYIWNLGDSGSWLENPSLEIASPNADPTLYFDDLSPKPAFFAMLKLLENFGFR